MTEDRRTVVLDRIERSRDSLMNAHDPVVKLYEKPGLAKAAAEKGCGYLAEGTFMVVPGTNKYAPVVILRPDQHWMRVYLMMKGIPVKRT